MIDEEGLDAAARDFLAGMTDRYAVSLYEQLFIPKPWVCLRAPARPGVGAAPLAALTAPALSVKTSS